MMRKLVAGVVGTFAGMALMGGTAFGMDCTNASKDAHASTAGVQIIIDLTNNGAIEWASPGVMQRIANGTIDPVTGAGFHGEIGFDVDGNGTVDAVTYLVGPNNELPQTAQNNGSPCHGITSLATYFTQCVTP